MKELKFPIFLTRQVVDKSACVSFSPNATFLVLKHRGSEDHDIELSLENGESIDTFLLKTTDPFLTLEGHFGRICYKTDTTDKQRLDVFASA